MPASPRAERTPIRRPRAARDSSIVPMYATSRCPSRMSRSHARVAICASSGTTASTSQPGSGAASTRTTGTSSGTAGRSTRWWYMRAIRSPSTRCARKRATRSRSASASPPLSATMSSTSRSRPARRAPSMMRPANGVAARSSPISPTTPVRRRRSPLATRSGTYPSSRATARIRSRVSALTARAPLSACETVVGETPAAAATSLTRARPLPGVAAVGMPSAYGCCASAQLSRRQNAERVDLRTDLWRKSTLSRIRGQPETGTTLPNSRSSATPRIWPFAIRM